MQWVLRQGIRDKDKGLPKRMGSMLNALLAMLYG